MRKFIKSFVFFYLIFSGCSSESQLTKTYEIILEPVKKQNLTSYYVSGLPLGASSVNNFNIIFNLQPYEILGDEYLRLWFLIQNNSEQEILFEPSKEFKLIYSKSNESNFEAIPESPLEFLKSIESSKQADMIAQTIGSALKSMGTTNTTITNKDKETQLEINDANEKRGKINSEYNEKIVNINYWYDFYSDSFNQGVLRKNTLFPGRSVNGYIYFKLPSKNVSSNWLLKTKQTISLNELKNYKVSLQGEVLLKNENIKFKIVRGE